MRIVTTKRELRETLGAARSAGRSIGFAPTMGALHDGHASLIELARAECDLVLVSIFVNPLQFGPAEDLARYPRNEEGDRERCRSLGVDLLFLPSVEEMLGEPGAIRIEVGPLGDRLCGASRPGHFNGVATIVANLFDLSGRCTAYFGEKDAQQLVVIRQLVDDLDIPVTVVGCPTIREPDGLAMSSRNVYLSPEERSAATSLPRAVFGARDAIAAGERSAEAVQALVRATIEAEPLAEIDYLAVVDPRTLEDLDVIGDDALIAVAVRFGDTRLIDNIAVSTVS